MYVSIDTQLMLLSCLTQFTFANGLWDGLSPTDKKKIHHLEFSVFGEKYNVKNELNYSWFIVSFNSQAYFEGLYSLVYFIMILHDSYFPGMKIEKQQAEIEKNRREMTNDLGWRFLKMSS